MTLREGFPEVEVRQGEIEVTVAEGHRTRAEGL